MLGHYLGRYDGGRYAKAVVEGRKDEGTDAHSVTAKIVGLNLRDSAKTFIYALIYGAGDEKLGKIIRQDAIDAGKPVPPGTLKALGSAARAKIEKGIVGFGELKRALLNKVRLDGWVSGLDGRRLHIRSQHAALNTLLQSGGAVLMKRAAALFLERHEKTHGTEWAFVANVHDEVQIEAKDRETGETLGRSFAECITAAGESFQLRCPFTGAYDIGSNWSETH
jgi:DNA polymerase-1